MTAAKVCVECLNIIIGLTDARCPRCQKAKDAASGPRIYDRRSYRAEQARVVAAAEADPDVVCWLCRSRTAPPGYDGSWSADHERPGDVSSPLQPAHLGCNSARGDRPVSTFRRALLRRFPEGW